MTDCPNLSADHVSTCSASGETATVEPATHAGRTSRWEYGTELGERQLDVLATAIRKGRGRDILPPRHFAALLHAIERCDEPQAVYVALSTLERRLGGLATRWIRRVLDDHGVADLGELVPTLEGMPVPTARTERARFEARIDAWSERIVTTGADLQAVLDEIGAERRRQTFWREALDQGRCAQLADEARSDLDERLERNLVQLDAVADAAEACLEERRAARARVEKARARLLDHARRVRQIRDAVVRASLLELEAYGYRRSAVCLPPSRSPKAFDGPAVGGDLRDHLSAARRAWYTASDRVARFIDAVDAFLAGEVVASERVESEALRLLGEEARAGYVLRQAADAYRRIRLLLDRAAMRGEGALTTWGYDNPLPAVH